MTDLPVLEHKIPALIAEAKPARLLTVGLLARALIRPATDAGIELTDLPTDGAQARIAAQGHQDMAIVAGELDSLGVTAAEQLLSQLRDLYAAWVIVVCDRDDPPPGFARRNMIGLGFSLLGDALYGDSPMHVYEFDMATYKTTPDWLNSRNWANPELWDKYRW